MATDQLHPAETQPVQQPVKYARYKKVQRSNTVDAHAQQRTVNPPAAPQVQNANIARSMSRYRRPRAATQAQSAPPTPQLNSNVFANNAQIQAQRSASQTQYQAAQQVRPSAGSHQPSFTAPLKEPAYHPQQVDIDEPSQLEMLKAQQERISAEIRAAEARAAEKAALLIEESKRKDLERLEATLEAAAATNAAERSRPSTREQQSTRDKLNPFSRKRSRTRGEADREAIPESIPAVPAPLPLDSNKLAQKSGRPEDVPVVILKAGNGRGFLGVDAPIAAINAGERRVEVRYNTSTIQLPFTATTTAKEFIYSALNVLPTPLEPETAILLECYSPKKGISLEKRIRRYEHIRDIANSWDRDTQNALFLAASDRPGRDDDLLAASVPKKCPGMTTVQIYHSHKPGKWAKNYITLLPNGQIFVSKKAPENTKAKVIPIPKDAVSIAHLSDFDIYNPSPSNLKYLKPPKKYAFALKSQMKASMFMDKGNFMHYFCTNDLAEGTVWYDACQAWRSWYLIQKIGLGQASPVKKEDQAPKLEDKYMIGTHEPLGIDTNIRYSTGLDLDWANKDTLAALENRPQPSATQRQQRMSRDFPQQQARTIPFHLRHGAPPPPQSPPPQPRRSHHASPTSPLSPSEGVFEQSGLLGRSYTQRKASLQKSGNPDFHAGAFTGGQSLLSKMADGQRPTTRGNGGRSATMRSEKASPFTGMGGIDTQTLSRMISTRSHRRPSISQSQPQLRPSTSRSQPPSRPGTSGSGSDSIPPVPVIPGLGQPLVDLTPHFKEPPQFSKEGKGRGVHVPAAMVGNGYGLKLVDIAGGGEAARMSGEYDPREFRRTGTMGGRSIR